MNLRDKYKALLMAFSQDQPQDLWEGMFSQAEVIIENKRLYNSLLIDDTNYNVYYFKIPIGATLCRLATNNTEFTRVTTTVIGVAKDIGVGINRDGSYRYNKSVKIPSTSYPITLQDYKYVVMTLYKADGNDQTGTFKFT